MDYGEALNLLLETLTIACWFVCFSSQQFEALVFFFSPASDYISSLDSFHITAELQAAVSGDPEVEPVGVEGSSQDSELRNKARSHSQGTHKVPAQTGSFL